MDTKQFDEYFDEEFCQTDLPKLTEETSTADDSPAICVTTPVLFQRLNDPTEYLKAKSIYAVSAAKDLDAAGVEIHRLRALGLKSGSIYCHGQGALGFQGGTIFEHHGFEIGQDSTVNLFQDYVAALNDAAIYGLPFPRMIEHGLAYVAMRELGLPAIELGLAEVDTFMKSARRRSAGSKSAASEFRLDVHHRMQRLAIRLGKLLVRLRCARLLKVEGET